MAYTKWQCKECCAISANNGERPSMGGRCSKSKDNKHKWTKIVEKYTKWQCKLCRAGVSNNGQRPSMGGACSQAADRKHKWVKISL